MYDAAVGAKKDNWKTYLVLNVTKLYLFTEFGTYTAVQTLDVAILPGTATLSALRTFA